MIGRSRIAAPRRSPEHTAFGRAVRITRAIRGLSQEELGFRSGIHRNYVGAIERGEQNPTLRNLMRLSDGLGVPLSELMTTYEAVLTGREDRIGVQPTAYGRRLLNT